MVEEEHGFHNLCCGPAVPAVSLVPLSPQSQAILSRTPFILAPLSLAKDLCLLRSGLMWDGSSTAISPFHIKGTANTCTHRAGGVNFRTQSIWGWSPPGTQSCQKRHFTQSNILPPVYCRAVKWNRTSTQGILSMHILKGVGFSIQEFREVL